MINEYPPPRPRGKTPLSPNPKRQPEEANSIGVRCSIVRDNQSPVFQFDQYIFPPPVQSILEMISDFRDDRSSRTIPDYQLTIFPRRRRVAILKMKMSMFLLSESKEKI